MTDTERSRRCILVSSLTGTFVGGLVYLLILLDLDTDAGRTARSIRYASGFFELQAKSLFDGHLSVPPGSLGIEGFVIDGQTYTYFGPFPALLRMPLMLVTEDFNGRLTLASMLLGFIVASTMVARLVWLVRRLLVGNTPVTRLDAVLATLLLILLTGGTSLTFDASLPWAYHEVYVWQTALVTAAVYWMARVAQEPSTASVGWLAAAALGAVLTRTTGGWGVCLGIIVLAAWMRWGRTFTGHRELWPKVLLAAVVPLAVGVMVNIAKFDHPYMFPLANQVWTDVNEHRRTALEVNGGHITGPQFFLTSLVNYFSPTGIRFVEYFPWVTFPPENARGYGGAFIDQSYRTGSVTAFMPLPLLLALVSLTVLLRPTRRSGARGRGVRVLRPPALATFLMTGGVMAYGYIAYRYTSEFVPALVLGTIITLWAYLARWAARSVLTAVLVVAVLAAGTAWSVATHISVGLYTSATTYRGAPLERYLEWQQDISGGEGSALSQLISHSPTLPRGGVTDQLHIRGACDGLYLNTGDEHEPWLLVQERSRVVNVSFPRWARTGEVTLFEVRGNAVRRVVLETERRGHARIRIDNEGGSYFGQYFRPAPGEILRVGMKAESDLGYLEVSSSPGGFVGYLPSQEWDENWVSRINVVTEPFRSGPRTHPGTGTRISPAQGIDLPLCQRIARANSIDISR